MRRGQVGQWTINLTDKEHRMLLDRFDLRNVTTYTEKGFPGKRYIIRKPCLCIIYKDMNEDNFQGCYSVDKEQMCPLAVEWEHSCSHIIDRLTKGAYLGFLLDTESIEWSKRDSAADEAARLNIKIIRRALTKMEKYEEVKK